MAATTAEHRLPRHVLPHHYELLLAPDLDTGGFTGSVTIDVEVREAASSITLHALDLDVTTVWVRPDGGRPVDGSTSVHPGTETVTLHFADEIAPGNAELHLEFSGTLSDKLVGLYRSTFESGGEQHSIAVTQFESTHARRAFPCFDEPDFKARFAITLVVADGLTAVSNAAETARETAADGTVRVRFAETVRISTYLVAMVIGPLECTEPRMVAGRDGPIPLRVVHPPGQGHLAGFALDVAEAALVFFEDWYALPYPGDKVDLVAVPDFAFGAMENLGCITFREVLLLVDPTSATQQELQRVADVINHELAHMWFGDLVTMSWWNGIWLNEAFATFMEVTATDSFRPEWDVWTTFGLARAAAFDTDALASTRPIEYEVRSPGDAEGMFDILTYEKGCSVVRMLEQYLGPRRFRDGIRAYLRLNAWGNTETTDLWDAIEDVTGEPVRRIMDEWIFRGGHPVVTVSADDAGVQLHQELAVFPTPVASAAGVSAAGRSDAAPVSDRPFPVPMVVEIADAEAQVRTERVLLEDPVTLPTEAGATRVQANVGGNGFYRTRLSGDLRTALARSGGTPLERFVLVDDTWFAVLAGHLSPEAATELIEEVVSAGEDDPSVWRRIAAACGELRRLTPLERRSEVAAWVRTLIRPPTGRFPPDATVEGRPAEVAATLVSLAGVAGEDPAARSRAQELFGWPEAGDGLPSVDPALRAAGLEVVASRADAEEHAEIERRWRQAPTPQEEQRHLAALVLTDHPACFGRALELTLDDVRTQDAPYVLRRALTNAELGPAAWRFVRDHWTELTDRLPSSSLPRMLEGIRGFTDAAVAEDVAAFLAGHPLPSGERQVAQHVERMWATVAAAARLATPRP